MDTITITPEEEGKRIEVVCAQRYPVHSRTAWQKGGSFFLQNKEKPGKTKVQAGEEWGVECQEVSPPTDHLEPWDYPLDIVAESETWLVINKPEGVSVHPTPTEDSNHTIVNALIHRFGINGLADPDSGRDAIHRVSKNPRPGIVHRLDKPTSGLLLIAKTTPTLRYFQSHWKTVEKIYFAQVQGTPPPKGIIEGAITRHKRDRTKMALSNAEEAKYAETHFETIESHENQSTLRIKIPTGRTHQIRVHLSALGFPIIGDEKYKGPSADRLYLHAQSLSFPDPDKEGERKTVEIKVPFGKYQNASS